VLQLPRLPRLYLTLKNVRPKVFATPISPVVCCMDSKGLTKVGSIFRKALSCRGIGDLDEAKWITTIIRASFPVLIL
jgi:hypothetical protein